MDEEEASVDEVVVLRRKLVAKEKECEEFRQECQELRQELREQKIATEERLDTALGILKAVTKPRVEGE